MRVGLKWSYKGACWFYFFKLMCLHSKRATWKQTSKLKFAILNLQFSSVQSLSRVWLCNPMNRSTPGLPVHHQLPEWTQTHVHRISDAIQPSHPLSSPSPSAPNAMLCYAKSLQSCPTLCDPKDGSLPGSPVSGILQARTLDWVAISFSNAWKWKVKVKLLSHVRLLATPWIAA